MSDREVTPIDAEVGRRIRLERQKAEWSQSALAERLGISFQQVQKYELGKNRITIGRLIQIAMAFGTPLSTFTDGLEELAGKLLKGKRRS